mgnify:CR=1 FL=1
MLRFSKLVLDWFFSIRHHPDKFREDVRLLLRKLPMPRNRRRLKALGSNEGIGPSCLDMHGPVHTNPLHNHSPLYRTGASSNIWPAFRPFPPNFRGASVRSGLFLLTSNQMFSNICGRVSQPSASDGEARTALPPIRPWQWPEILPTTYIH